jgi:molybdopterin converting factor small subunit
MGMIRIEFYGIPRERTGVGSVDLEADCVSMALRQVGERFPEFANRCMNGDRLAPGLIMNLNGEKFTSDPTTRISDGDSLLILSADVGG